MQSKKTLKTIIVVLVLLTLAGGGYLYTLMKKAGDQWPLLDSPGSLTVEISALQRDVNALQAEVNKIPAAREELAALQKEYDLAVRVLPTESRPEDLLDAIAMKAQQSGVTPLRMTPQVGGGARGGGAAQGSFQEWTFSLDIRGTYDQIAAFINRMEEFESGGRGGEGERRFFQVREIDITAAESGMAVLGDAGLRGDVAGHECKLVMQTYRYTGGE